MKIFTAHLFRRSASTTADPDMTRHVTPTATTTTSETETETSFASPSASEATRAGAIASPS